MSQHLPSLRWLAWKTTDRDHVAFKVGSGRVVMKSAEIEHGVSAENFLSLLDRFLSSSRLGLDDIDTLVVVAGPGSFTSVRIGVAIANALSLAASIPLLGIRDDAWETFPSVIGRRGLRSTTVFHPIHPIYSKPPNINLKKS